MLRSSAAAADDLPPDHRSDSHGLTQVAGGDFPRCYHAATGSERRVCQPQGRLPQALRKAHPPPPTTNPPDAAPQRPHMPEARRRQPVPPGAPPQRLRRTGALPQICWNSRTEPPGQEHLKHAARMHACQSVAPPPRAILTIRVQRRRETRYPTLGPWSDSTGFVTYIFDTSSAYRCSDYPIGRVMALQIAPPCCRRGDVALNTLECNQALTARLVPLRVTISDQTGSRRAVRLRAPLVALKVRNRSERGVGM